MLINLDSGRTDSAFPITILITEHTQVASSESREKSFDSVNSNSMMEQQGPIHTRYESLQRFIYSLSRGQVILEHLDTIALRHSYCCIKHLKRVIKLKQKIDSIINASQKYKLCSHKDIVDAGILLETLISWASLLKRNIRKCVNCLPEARACVPEESHPVPTLTTTLSTNKQKNLDKLEDCLTQVAVTPSDRCNQSLQALQANQQAHDVVDTHGHLLCSRFCNIVGVKADKPLFTHSVEACPLIKKTVCSASKKHELQEEEEKTESTVADSHTEPEVGPHAHLPHSSSDGHHTWHFNLQHGQQEVPPLLVSGSKDIRTDLGKGIGYNNQGGPTLRLPQSVPRPLTTRRESIHTGKDTKAIFSFVDQATGGNKTMDSSASIVFSHNDNELLHCRPGNWHNIQTIDFLMNVAPNVCILPPPTHNPFTTKDTH